MMLNDLYFERGLSIALSLLILLNAGLFRFLTGAWTSPPVVASLAWFAFTLGPCLLLWPVPINSLAVLYIFVCVFVFSLGSFFTWGIGILPSETHPGFEKREYWDLPTIGVFGSLIAMSLISIVPHLATQGISVMDYVHDLHGTTGKYMSMKYLGQIEKSPLFSPGLIANYVATMIGGLLFASAIRISHKTAILTLAMLPSLLFMVLYGDKGTLFLCGAFFYGAMVSVDVRAGHTRLATWRMLKTLPFIIPILLTAVISALVSRGMRSDDPLLLQFRLSFSIQSYALGHLYAFADWFSSHIGLWRAQQYTELPTATGYLSLLSFMKATGINSSLPDGYFSEYLLYPAYFQTNIYTIFRGLIQDFGIYGGIFVSFVVGVLSSICYYFMLRLPRAGIFVSAYVLLFGAIYTSFIISMFVWLSPVIAALVFAVGIELHSRLRSAKMIPPNTQVN
jgi:oligosaccharide repeat unit polymerase